MPPRLLGLALACLITMSGCAARANGPEVVDFKVIENGNVQAYPEARRRTAPKVTGDLLTGPGQFDPATLEGKVTVVNFWASWCGPCRKEQPLLRDLAERYEARGVRFVGINTRRDQRAAAQAFLEEFEMWDGSGEPVYPSIYDPRSRNAFSFRLFFMPATFVVDREGRIAAFVAGGLPDEKSLTSILDDEVR